MTKKIKNRKAPKQTPWDITADRFVGYIDIMGFKDLVARNDHQTVYMMMKKVAEAMEVNQSVYAFDYETEGNDMNIIMMTYSDSIMIYSRNNSESSLDSFIGAVSALSEDLFKDEIPHKGAIAYGTMTLDFGNSIFFGQPLIDAYLLQEELNFYGIVVHSTAEYKKGFIEDISVVEYDCPFKNGHGKHLTVLPSTFVCDPFDKKEYLKLKKSVSKLRIKTSGALRKYIDNTISYLDYSCSELLKKIDEVEKERGKITGDNDSLPF